MLSDKLKYVELLLCSLIIIPIILCCFWSVPGTWDDINRWVFTSNYESFPSYFQQIKYWINNENGRIGAAIISLLPYAYEKYIYGFINLMIFGFFIFAHYFVIQKIKVEHINKRIISFVVISLLLYLYSSNSKELVSLFFNLSRTTVYTTSFTAFLYLIGVQIKNEFNFKNVILVFFFLLQ